MITVCTPSMCRCSQTSPVLLKSILYLSIHSPPLLPTSPKEKGFLLDQRKDVNLHSKRWERKEYHLHGPGPGERGWVLEQLGAGHTK